MKKVRVSLGERSYDILIGSGLLRNCGAFLKRLDLGKDTIVVTNSRLLRLYGKTISRSLLNSGFSVHFETVPDSEKAKSAEVAIRLLSRIAKYDVRRRIFIIAFGGGVVGDLAGFVAAIYKRGVPYVQMPTTLLSQVDSAIGGKTAIDLKVAKNLVGAFYQPKVVISDISILKTLPQRQLKNGMAEIIKYGVIKDRGLFSFLQNHLERHGQLSPSALEYMITKASRIKASLVSKDEFDKKGIRAILNYGHTIGHAIEAACGYSKRYNHGEAVAIGMVAASRLSVSLGIMDRHDAQKIESLIRKAGLPVSISGLSFRSVYRAIAHDKKFIHATNRFILPVRIGSAKVVEGVPERLIKTILKALML
ncbi:MAG: 3-dehydroquinate synthase [Candidatus Omnitrophica bacterium]|nr:3-dehydroquinate synthase [Candidatus Omnitrophota bacterium]